MLKTKSVIKKEINKKYPRRNGIYYIDDKKYISITNILQAIAKPQLIPWAAKGAARYALNDPTLTEAQAAGAIYGERDEKAKIGSTVHSFIEALEQGAKINTSNLPPKYKGYADSYNKFIENWKPKILKFDGKPLKEYLVHSEKYGIAGRMDTALQLHNGKTGIVDWKTGGVYGEAQLQGEAYKVCIEEMGILKPDFTATLQLHPSGEAGTFKENKRGDFRVFLATMILWKWLNPKMVEIINQKDDNA